MCTTAVAMFGLKVPNRRKYIDFRPWRYSRCLAGPETSILSPDVGLAASPPNESQRYAECQDLSWKAESLSPSKLPVLRYSQQPQDSLVGRHRDKDKLLSRSALLAPPNAGQLKDTATRDHHHRHHHHHHIPQPLHSPHHPHHHRSSGSHLSNRNSSASSSSSPSSSTSSGLGTHPRGESNGAALDRRMNTNGLDRSAMTGSSSTTSENLTWLADVATCQAQGSQRSAPGILTNISTGSGAGGGGGGVGVGHDPHPMLTGLAGPSSLFRPPLTLSESAQRLYAGNQYAPIYTTTGTTTLSPYSLYSAQSTALSPFSAFYHHYPHAAYNSTGTLLSHYPQIDQSYSAVLASMGSHMQQHVTPSQLPRSPFLPGGHLAAYSTLAPPPPPGSPGTGSTLSRSLTPVGALSSPPSGSSLQGQGHHSSDSHRPEPKSPHKSDHRHASGSIAGVESKHSVSHSHTSPLHPKVGQPLLKDSPTAHDPKTLGVSGGSMAGKEGSWKHRLLTRTPEGQFVEPKHLPFKSASTSSLDEPPSKRHKGIGLPPPLHPSHHPHFSHTAAAVAAATGHHVEGLASHLPPPPPLHPTGYQPHPSHHYYPQHFMRGSIIQLANGELKRVEDLRTDDFVNSADVSGDLKIDSSTVVRIEVNMERGTALLGFSVGEHRVQVTVEATLEHPFFVFGQGWSSCRPERTSHRYGLSCHKLSVGDVCISLTHKDVSSRAAELSAHQRVQRSSSAGQISGGAKGGGGQAAPEQARSTLTPKSRATGETAEAGGKAEEKDISTDREDRDSPVSPRNAPGDRSPGGGDNGTGKSRKRRWSAPDDVSAENSPNEAPASEDQGQGQMDPGECHANQCQGQGSIKDEPPQA